MWFLLAVAFVVAVFAIVGCKPAETPEASPSPSPSPAPTPDTRCPQPVSTVVQSLYNPFDEATANTIKIVITFDEPIAGDVDCIENPAYWTFTIVNETRYDGNPDDAVAPGDDVDFVGNPTIILSEDGKTITIKGKVKETDLENLGTGVAFNYGLICDEESAKAYREALDGTDKDGKVGTNGTVSVSKFAKVADKIKWKLSAWCQVYDELGNVCCEPLEGEACCSPVCEPVTPPSGCPL